MRQDLFCRRSRVARASLLGGVSLLATLASLANPTLVQAQACMVSTGGSFAATAACIDWTAGNLSITSAGTLTGATLTSSPTITMADVFTSANVGTFINSGSLTLSGVTGTSDAAIPSVFAGLLNNGGSISSATNTGNITVTASMYFGTFKVAAAIANLGGTIQAVSNAGLLRSDGNMDAFGGGGGGVNVGMMGIYNSGVIGILTNATGGTITAVNSFDSNQSDTRGIVNASGGTIAALVNEAGATITAAIGILSAGAIGTLTNVGLINAVGSSPTEVAAIKIAVGGTIGTIVNDGTLIANTGILIEYQPGAQSVGYIENNGVIQGENSGIYIGANAGTLTNNGTISAGADIVRVDTSISLGTLVNNGLMQSAFSSALHGQGSIGTVTNNGTITAQYYAVLLDNTSTIQSFSNKGAITAIGGTYTAPSSGAFFATGVVGALTNEGLISGVSQNGVANFGSIGTLNNSGTIEGIGTIAGVSGGVWNVGTISSLTNEAGGVILSDFAAAIRNSSTSPSDNGTIGTLTNSGMIRSANATAIENFGTIGLIDNRGTIQGAVSAIYNEAILGQLTNSGLIAGDIVNNAASDLTISGGTGTIFGTLTGASGSVTSSAIGNISSTQANIVFVGGNLLLNDSIDVTGHSAINSGATLKIANDLTLQGTYEQTAGLLDLNGKTLNQGDVTFSGGTITSGLSNATGLFAQSGGVLSASVSADTYQFTGGTVTAGGTITASTDFDLQAGGDMTAVLAGSGDLTKSTTSTLILSSANTYTGTTSVTSGILRATNASSLGATSSGTTISDGATLQLSGGIAIGTENLTLSGTGASGATGALQSMSGINSLAGDIALAANSRISVDAGTLTLSGTFSQIGATPLGLDILGAGTLVLSGQSTLAANELSGDSTVTGAKLVVNGSFGSAASLLTVSGGGTLAGAGTIGGSVNITDGSLAPGNSPGTLTINGNLSLASSSVLNFEFGQADTVGGSLNDLVVVQGNLTLDGTLNVSQAQGGTYGPGVYRVISYSGTLTDNGLDLGTMPVGSTNTVQTSVAGQVNLLTTGSITLNFWDGDLGPKNNGVINGGNGTWTAATSGPHSDNWTNDDGTVNGAYSSPSYAVFMATPGAVTVDTTGGPVTVSGIQFAVGGYQVSGGVITLAASSGQTVIRVGDGTADGASYVATISSVLAGTTGLEKTDLGKLVLTGANTFTGATTVSSGELAIGGGASLSDTAALTVAASALLTLMNANETVGSLAGAGDVALNSYCLITGGSGGSTSFSGAISGSGCLEKTGAGVMTLSGANTFTGETTVSGGELALSGGASLSDTALLTIGVGALLTLTDADETVGGLAGAGDLALNGYCLTTGGSGASSSFSGGISGSGCVTKTGTGTLTLTGVNSYSGGTTISEGAIEIDNALALGTGALALQGAGALNVTTSFAYASAISLTPIEGSGGGTLGVAETQTLTLTGVISGAGDLTKTGAGILLMTGLNTYTGATNVADGELRIGGGSSLSDTARLSVAAGALLSLTDANESVGSLAGGGEVALNGYCLTTGGDGSSSSFSGAITGAGCLTKTGAGTLTLTGDGSNYSGGTNVAEGTVQVYGASALGTGPLALTGSGVLRASNTFTYASAISLATGLTGGFEVDGTAENPAVETLTLTGPITGLGNLNKTGLGTLVISGINTGSGATNVTAGILIAEGGNALGDASAVSVALGAQLIIRPSGATETVGSLGGAGAITLDGATLAAGGDNSSTTFSGVISGSGGLTKAGTGVMTLSGANGYTGDTNVTGGGLVVAGSLDSDVYVYDQATLSGSGSISKTVHVLSGGTLAGVQGSGLSMGALDLQGGSNVNVTLGAPSEATTVFTVAGNVTLDGTLNVTPTPGFGIGIYRIMTYGGTLTDNGMEVGALSGGLSGGIQSSIQGQVNLFVEGPDSPILFWNGSNTTPTQSVLGGTGTWTAGSQTNWINASGTIPRAWNGGFAVFQGAAGTVTVDTTDGPVMAIGMQFVETGYVVTGGPIALTGGAPVIRVGDGTESGASTVATIQSVLTGVAGLEKADFGTLILTGANSYTGGTTISGGTLQLGDGGTSGAVLGDIVNNAALVFNRSDDTSFAGVISGTGSVLKTGAGTLALTGTNTYSGGTSINQGTLQVTSASALGTGALTVGGTGVLRASGSFAYGNSVTLAASVGTFEVDASQALTLSGVVGGTGGLTKTGDGLLILTGANTYSGVTTISAGTLQIGNGGETGAIVGDVVNNANLVFNRSDTYAFTGAITGAGQVTFTGGGTVEFSAPYQGPVAVDNSFVQLQAGSTTVSPFTVNAGGVLGGTATIGGLTVNTGGTAAPGYSPGTLTVNGAVTFNAGSVYAVDVNTAGAHDLIIATGTATLSSSAHVEVLAEYGRYPALSQITILTAAGGVSGTFSEDVTSNFAFLTPQLTYDATNVYLTLTYTGIDFVEYAQTPNQANVAVAAQALGAGSPVFEAIFGLAANEVPAAFNQLTGEIYPSINTVIQQESTYLRDAVGARLRQSVTPQGASALSYAAQAAGPANTKLSQDLTPTLWMQGYGGWGNAFGNTNAASISSTVGGFFAGLDVSVLDNVRAGVVAGFSQTQFDVDARNSSGTMDNYDIGFYAGGQFGAWALRGGASYTWHDISVSRSIVFPGFSGSTSAGYTLGTTQVFGEVGYDFNIGAYAFEPFAGLAYLNISGGNLAESGLASNGAGLNVSTDSQNTLYTTLGIRAATSLSLGGRTLTPSATLGWQHAFGDTTPTATMLFQSGATPFAISGVPIAENTLLLGAGLAYALSDLATLQVNYTGQLAGDASQNAFTAQFSLKF